MPPHLQLFESDGVTPAAAFSFSVEAGTSSATKEYVLYNDKGLTFGDTTPALPRLVIAGWNGSEWVKSGYPQLDQLMFRATVIGQIATADPSQVDYVTASLPFGAGSEPLLPAILPGNARRFTVQMVPPGTAENVPLELKLFAVPDEYSAPMPLHSALSAGTGVVPGYRDPSLRKIIRGSIVTADGSDMITLSRGAQDFDGIRTNFPQTTETLDQNAADGALGVGDSYAVLLSRASDATVTVTKSNKGAAPAVPALPADEIPVASFVVAYNAGGTAIVQGDITQISGSFDYRVEAGAGLSVRVYGGRGVTSANDHYQYGEGVTILNVPALSTRYVWRLPDGTPALSSASTAPPMLGADLLAKVITDGVGVTAVNDLRTFAGPAILEHVEEIRYADSLSQVAPDTDIGHFILPFAADLESVTVDLSDTEGTWTADAVKIGIRAIAPGLPLSDPGTSIYDGTDDQRPAIAYNAAVLRVTGIDHVTRRFAAGTRFVVSIAATVTAPAPEDEREIIVQCHFTRQ